MPKSSSFKRKQIQKKGKINPFGKKSKINPDILFLERLGIKTSPENVEKTILLIQELVKQKGINLERAAKEIKNTENSKLKISKKYK